MTWCQSLQLRSEFIAVCDFASVCKKNCVDYLGELNCLTLSQTSPGFFRVCGTSLLKTLWEKEKLLVKSNFSYSHHVFYPFGELSAIFMKIETAVCKLCYLGTVSNLLIGKGLRCMAIREQLTRHTMCMLLKHSRGMMALLLISLTHRKMM